MSDHPDFVEGGDPFDPAYQEGYEKQRADALGEINDEARQYIAKKKRYYSEVFTEGETTQEAIDFVMRDLAEWGRLYAPTFHPTNPKLQDLAEGRRETVLRIVQYTRLSADALFIQYMTDVINRGS